MDSLCTEAQGEILPQGQEFVIQLFKYISDFPYDLEMSLVSFMLQKLPIRDQVCLSIRMNQELA